MNATEAIAAVNALTYPSFKRGLPEGQRRALRDNYNKALREITGQFRTWLAVTYSPNMPEAADAMIWDKAWADGHHAGFHEVETHYMDYAEFATAIADTLK